MTGIAGLRIGHATDAAAKTGVTVFLADQPVVAAVQVAGGAPATRETDLLRPGNSVERVDAIVLSGGSAFGLAAADGVMRWLASRGRGFAVGPVHVPIVPAACLFDLGNGGDKSALSPAAIASFYGALGVQACDAAEERTPVGSIGAGTGATTADLKGGFGAAEATLAGGVKVASFAAVNAVGRVTLGASPFFRAAPFEVGRRIRRPWTPLAAAAGFRGNRYQARPRASGQHHACGRRHRLRPWPRRGAAPRHRRA